MRKVALKTAAPVPPPGTLVNMRFGTSDVVATVLEDRGPLGVGGRNLVRVKFYFEATEDPVETEVPAEDLRIVALPGDPAEKRVGVEPAGNGWVGTYTAPDGRIAVVTDEMHTPERATRAALRWVKVGLSEKSGRVPARTREGAYVWRPDPRHLGRFAVFRQGRLGDEIIREHQ